MKFSQTHIGHKLLCLALTVNVFLCIIYTFETAPHCMSPHVICLQKETVSDLYTGKEIFVPIVFHGSGTQTQEHQRAHNDDCPLQFHPDTLSPPPEA